MKKIFLTLAISMMTLSGALAQEKIILLNEGNWQSDNGRVSYFEDGRMVSNQWFSEINKKKLGDTPNDIVQIGSNLLAIAVNWSNIVQFVTADGHDAGATEDVPNNRRLATDGSHLYVTSYAHECGSRTFTKGYVAKIDITTKKVVDAVEVGYEPEGIAYYHGHLFVANTGGYAAQESHDYESTVSIIDASTMKVVKTIDTGVKNLYGKMSQQGRYLLINSPGDYYETGASAVVFDCEAALSAQSLDCFCKLAIPATYSTAALDGTFLAIGSAYSYITNQMTFYTSTIDPSEALRTKGVGGVTQTLPGNMTEDIAKLASPYDIYVNPYTGMIYATDAGSYSAAGKLYQWDSNGVAQGNWKTYINPSHIIALPPNGVFASVDNPMKDESADDATFDLGGRRVSKHKGIVIKKGKKYFEK